MLRHSLLLALASASVLVVACSSGDAPTPPPQAQRQTKDPTTHGGDSPKAGPAGAPTSKSPAAGGAKIGDAATCGKKPNHEECFACCMGGPDAHPTKVDGDAFDKCMCDAAKKCPAECSKIYCSTEAVGSSSDDDPCASCQIDLAACEAAGEKACAADASCAGLKKCVQDAKCDGLPDGPNEDHASSSSSDSSDP